MRNFGAKLGRTAFIILLLIFSLAFFAYKQYWLCFFTLALMFVVSGWGRIKKLIIGKDKVEVQIPEDVIKKEQKESAEESKQV
jgi:hypothetical protein